MNTTIKIGVLVENKKEQLLLIKERNDSDNKYYWNIIKGTFEPEIDATFLETATREAKEEAGISIIPHALQSIMYLRKRNVTQLNVIALLGEDAPKLSSREEQAQRNENITEIKFFTSQELQNMGEHEFMSKRTFQAIHKWLKKTSVSLDILSFE